MLDLRNMAPSDKAICPGCGVALPPNLAVGFCPHCALKGALDLGDPPPAAAPAASTRAQVGRRLGDYELIKQIGRGGMGIVYQAHQFSLNRDVALKLVLDANQSSPRAIGRFQLEAEAAARLHHPNIVPIYEIAEVEEQHFLIMKLIEGESLARRMSAGEFRIAPDGQTSASVHQMQVRIARLLITVARAVHYAHEHGVLHRDIKPGNIIMDETGEPHLTDFGLAKLTDPGRPLSHSGDVKGTPTYMAPEQARGETVTRAADIYSLGVLLYELLVGRPPFSGTTPLETLRLITEQEPAHPTTASEGVVDLDLATICLKCLQKDSGRRYSSAQELADELGRFSRNEPIHARPVTRLERIWRWSKRKPALATIGAVAGLFAIWSGYSAWVITCTKWDTRKREDREWALLFDKNSPVNNLHWSSEDLAGFFGERPPVEAEAERLFVGMYLEADQKHMVSRFAPLLRYLEQSVSNEGKPVKFNLQVFAGRTALEQALGSTDPKVQVHLGRIGESALSRLLSDTNGGFVPLVQQSSGGKMSVIFTRSDTGITNLAGLKDRRIALGSRGSTASGYKLLKLMLQNGLTSLDLHNTFHDDSEQNIDRVLKRDFDAGVTRKDKFITYTNANLIVLGEFDTTRMPWVATKRTPPDLVRRIQAALTALEDLEILTRLPENAANGFAPVDVEYFRRVREDMERVNKLFFRNPDPPPR
jgi:serine/threonine protein kinase